MTGEPNGPRMFPPTRRAPERRIDLNRVSIVAGAAGLRMSCGACDAVTLVLLGEDRFDRHVEAFLDEHPGVCADADA